MKRFLVVVDMQKDFVDGSLGTAEAQAIVPPVAENIRRFDGTVFATLDTHGANYLETSEGRHLPVAHCIKGTLGWQLNADVAAALEEKHAVVLEKPTFGSLELVERIRQAAGDADFSVELIGLCTDICVVSNALLLKANFYEQTVRVDAACCAGVTPETHRAALTTMRMCQIEVENA